MPCQTLLLNRHYRPNHLSIFLHPVSELPGQLCALQLSWFSSIPIPEMLLSAAPPNPTGNHYILGRQCVCIRGWHPQPRLHPRQDAGTEEGWGEAEIRCCTQGQEAAECKSQELHTSPWASGDLQTRSCRRAMPRHAPAIKSFPSLFAFSFPRAFGDHQGKQEVFARLRDSVSKRAIKVCSNLQL